MIPILSCNIVSIITIINKRMHKQKHCPSTFFLLIANLAYLVLVVLGAMSIISANLYYFISFVAFSFMVISLLLSKTNKYKIQAIKRVSFILVLTILLYVVKFILLDLNNVISVSEQLVYASISYHIFLIYSIIAE